MRYAGGKDGSNGDPCGVMFLFHLGEFCSFGVSKVFIFDFALDLKMGPPLNAFLLSVEVFGTNPFWSAGLHTWTSF